MEIVYKFDKIPTPEEIIDLYDAANLPRPTGDKDRIKKMFENSNLIVTAWDNEKLVGVSRSITDWVGAVTWQILPLVRVIKRMESAENLLNLQRKSLANNQ